jgi:predicted transcriptional regulator
MLQRRWLVRTIYHAFRKKVSGNTYQDSQAPVARWDFLTNHAHVLTCVAHDPGIRLRDIAAVVAITERAAHRILSELVEEGYVLREREGRRNRYQVVPELPLRHPLVQEREVGDLLEVLLKSALVCNTDWRRKLSEPRCT